MNGIDCASVLTEANIQALKSAGIGAIGRYLGYKYMGWGKCLSATEAERILNAGLGIFPIWEGNPTSVGYFTYAQGAEDAVNAVKEMRYLYAPQGTTIYFTVDYDAQAKDMAAIEGYFEGVQHGLAGRYLMGAYGSYAVLDYLSKATYRPDRYMQTYAWSGGKVFPGNHIYQHLCDTTLCGVQVDLDTVNEISGLWGAKKMFENLVVWGGDDEGSAQLLADYLKAPTVRVDNVTDDLWACAKSKYKVGGGSFRDARLISGGDRFSTAQAVNNFIASQK